DAQASVALGFSFSVGSDQKIFDVAEGHFRESQNILLKNGYAASEDREFVRLLFLGLYDQGSLLAAKADACRNGSGNLCFAGNNLIHIPKEKMQAAAGKLYEDALAKYRNALRQLQPIPKIARASSELTVSEAELHSSQGQALFNLKRYPEAISAYGDAV